MVRNNTYSKNGSALCSVCRTFNRWCKLKHRLHLWTVQLLTVQLDEQIQALQNTLVEYTPSWKLHCIMVHVMYMQILILLSNYIRRFLSCTAGMYIRWRAVSIIWKANSLSCDNYLHHNMLQSPLFYRLPFQNISQLKYSYCIHSLYSKPPEQPLVFS